jgi:hypothetical protein
MRFAGVEHVVPDSAGNLQLQMPDGMLLQRAPVAYQLIDGQRQDVEAKFVLNADGTVGLALGNYDHTAALVIDPVLVYSTYLGGSYFDAALAVAVDAQGNSYVTGQTFSTDFPTVNAFDPDAFQPGTFYSAYDAFVTKFDPKGGVVFSTYLGSGTNYGFFGTSGQTIAVDAAGHIFVGGTTDSALFPAPDPAPIPIPPVNGAFDPYAGGFLSEFSADGSQLLYSTFIKGVGGLYDIALDSQGAVYALATDYRPFPIAFKLDPTPDINHPGLETFGLA